MKWIKRLFSRIFSKKDKEIKYSGTTMSDHSPYGGFIAPSDSNRSRGW